MTSSLFPYHTAQTLAELLAKYRLEVAVDYITNTKHSILRYEVVAKRIDTLSRTW